LDDFKKAKPLCQLQRCFVAAGRDRGIGVVREQPFDHLEPAGIDSKVQRRLASEIASVQLSAGFGQRGSGFPVSSPRRPVKGRRAIGITRARVQFVPEQSL